MYTVEDHPPPPSEFLLLPPLSTGGFSTGYVTVTRRCFSGDDEKLETLGNKHAKVYQLKDCTHNKLLRQQDLDPLPLTNNDHVPGLPFEMYVLESGEPPSRALNWKPLGFLSHIKRRTNDDRFPLSLNG
jgi:hypothetical protein